MSALFDNAKAEALEDLEKVRLSNGGGTWERERGVVAVVGFVNEWAGVAASGVFEQDKAEALDHLERIRAVSAGDGWERERRVSKVVEFVNEWAGVADE